ncbi:hypothetical protein K1X84_07580 [bacterium]|nr:hypothetical protein [bacterium]
MKRSLGFIATIITIMALGWSGCAQKPKEIPMDAFVKIFLKMAGDEVFIKKYQRPEDAPIDEIEKFTQPLGYTGADFKHTMAEINKNDEKKKQFNDISTQAIMEEAMKSLDEKALSDSADTEKQ